jgi:hypothetical protein
MVTCLTAASDAAIAAVLRDPPLVFKLIAPEEPELYEAARAQGGSAQSWWSRLFGKPAQPNPGPEAFPGETDIVSGEAIDLDKAWHGIHYLLTGTAGEGEEPLNFLVAGGTPVGDVDVGYGPARAFNATETARIASAMSAIDEATMRARFDGAEMTRLEIYPEIWDRPGDEEDVAGYCIENFDTLKAFIADTAARSAGMVVFLC